MADGSVTATSSVPRHDPDAEAAVLSAALLDEGAALELADTLGAGDFYLDANRRIFCEIRELCRQSVPPDVVTVVAALRTHGRLEQIGGTPYIAQLADATPAIAHLRDHARIIRNLARVRKAIDTFRILQAEAATVGVNEIDGWLESCETRAYLATSDRGDAEETAASYFELAKATYDRIEAAHQARLRGEPRPFGISTGFECVDNHIGGLFDGQLIVIGARPGSGKTSLLLQLAEAIAKQDLAVIILSMEMTRDELMARSMGRESGTPARALLQGYPEDWNRLAGATELLSKLPIEIDDDSYLTPLRARAKVRRLFSKIRARHPEVKKIGGVLVDYIQLMDADDGDARRSDNRSTEIGRCTGGLKRMAKQMGFPVIAASQLNRAEKSQLTKPPTLESLRESGAIEQDADQVWFIHREDAHRQPGEAMSSDADLILAKVRGEQTGAHKLQWDGRRTRFYEQTQGAFA